MAKIDREARRELISQAADRQQRRRPPVPPRRPAVTCPDCTSLFEEGDSRRSAGQRAGDAAEYRAPGAPLP